MTAGSKTLYSLFVEWPSGKAPSRIWGHGVSVGGNPTSQGHCRLWFLTPWVQSPWPGHWVSLLEPQFPRTWNDVMPRSAWHDGTGSTHTLNQQASTAAVVYKHPGSYLAHLKNVHFPHCEVCSNRKESHFPRWIWENQSVCIAGPTLCISMLRLLE